MRRIAQFVAKNKKAAASVLVGSAAATIAAMDQFTKLRRNAGTKRSHNF